MQRWAPHPLPSNRVAARARHPGAQVCCRKSFALAQWAPETGEMFLKKIVVFLQVAVALFASLLLACLFACNSQPGSDVMATVDGRKIFRTDVDKYYDNNIASAQQAPTGEQATALRLNILHQMIEDEITMRRAEKLGLLATDEEVDRKYNELKSPFTQEEFDKRLKDSKRTVADIKRDIRRSITLDKVINKEVSSGGCRA